MKSYFFFTISKSTPFQPNLDPFCRQFYTGPQYNKYG